jgi:large subunit ribosomal protein L18
MKKLKLRKIRQKRVRAKIHGDKGKPRLSIFRSNRGIYAQIIDDVKGQTLVSFSDKKLKGQVLAQKTKTEIAGIVGEELAKLAKTKKLKRVVFDRGGYRYHGRVKALADGARKGGLEF